MTFSFGTNSKEYRNWIYSILQKKYCNKPVYTVTVNTKNKEYINYRLKTKTLPLFTSFGKKCFINMMK